MNDESVECRRKRSGQLNILFRRLLEILEESLKPVIRIAVPGLDSNFISPQCKTYQFLSMKCSPVYSTFGRKYFVKRLMTEFSDQRRQKGYC